MNKGISWKKKREIMIEAPVGFCEASVGEPMNKGLSWKKNGKILIEAPVGFCEASFWRTDE